MKLVVWAFSILASAYAQTSNRGQPCITPNNENATCIAARSCKLIFEPLGTRDPMAIDFAKRSLCGYDTEPLFCCGSLAHLTRKDRGQSCITPNKEHATCIPASSCKIIIDALVSRDPMAIDFGKRSQCGYDTVPLLCCGSSAYLYPERTNDTGSVSNQLDIHKVLPDRTSCGLDGPSSIILGGEITQFDEFPWLAVLEYKNKSTGVSLGIKCGGSLITERYILTAAHCLGGGDVALSRAWLGDWNITSEPDCIERVGYTECSDPVLKINIARIIPHSGFIEATGKDDIGLLRLEKAVEFTEYIRPICLPSENLSDLSPDSFLTVAGWGIRDDGKQSDVKLTGEVQLLSSAACNVNLSTPLTANQYCAVDKNGKGSCKGDSGGPLMRVPLYISSLGTRWFQEGIVSNDLGCGHHGYPVIYTRVSKYVNWIENAILQDKF